MDLQKMQRPLIFRHPLVTRLRESTSGLKAMQEVILQKSPTKEVTTIGIGLSGATIGLWMQMNIPEGWDFQHVQVAKPSFYESTHRSKVEIPRLDSFKKTLWIVDDDVNFGDTLITLLAAIGPYVKNKQVEGLVARRLDHNGWVKVDGKIDKAMKQYEVDIKTWYYGARDLYFNRQHERSSYFGRGAVVPSSSVPFEESSLTGSHSRSNSEAQSSGQAISADWNRLVGGIDRYLATGARRESKVYTDSKG